MPSSDQATNPTLCYTCAGTLIWDPAVSGSGWRRDDVQIGESTSKPFVWGVWSVVALAFVVPWIAFSLFDIDCRASCDGPTYVLIGVFQLAVLVLILANLVWIARAVLRSELARRRPPPRPDRSA